MGVEVAIAAAVIGTAVQISAQKKAAKSQARAARENANAKRLQALDLLDRQEINAQALRAEGELLKGKQKVGFGGKGIDIGTESALNVIEETNSIVARQLLIDRREAEFKAAQLRSGAAIDVRLAGDIRSASRLQTAGTFLSGAGAVASAD